MERKKIIAVFSTMVILVIIMIVYALHTDIDKSSKYVDRAQVAKMVSFIGNSYKEMEKLDREIAYEDTNSSEWFDKYINASVKNGYFNIKEEEFGIHKAFTYEDLHILYKSLGLQITDFYELSFDIRKKQAKDKVTQSEWQEIYDKLLEKVSIQHDIQKRPILVFSQEENIVQTNEGTFHFEHLDFQDKIEKAISVYLKDGEIIEILGFTEEAVTLKNVWIKEGNNKEISVYFDGKNRIYACNLGTDKVEAGIVDLNLTNGKVSEIVLKPDKIQAKVVSVKKEGLELEGYDFLSFAEDYKIYKVYGILEMEDTSNILLGYDSIEFVVEDGKIAVALITEPLNTDMIRVLLNNDDYSSFYHDKVVVTAEQQFTLSYGKKSKTYQAGEKVSIPIDDDKFKKGRIKIETAEEQKIQILSIERSCGNPAYRGSIELENTENGILIVNEVPLEEYLYAVVPSEMPTSYGIEALKVQAICARSYAYSQLEKSAYAEYGANLDDSVSSQVYNNASENEDSIFAVKDTYGEALFYKKKTIDAYFFSTSYGYTSNSTDVWLSGAKTPEYLKGRLQAEKQEELDLSKEKSFRKFIQDSYEYDTYEKDYAWYRWKVTISAQNLKKAIERSLPQRISANANDVLIKNSSGDFVKGSIQSIGTVKGVQITERATSGLVKEVIITGSQATIKVRSEYNIRMLLSSIYDTVIRQDGSTVNNFSMLPSAYFYIEENTNSSTLTSITFYGGGYGHGVGMSQNGVKAMADQGYSAKEILNHYYKGAKIESIY